LPSPLPSSFLLGANVFLVLKNPLGFVLPFMLETKLCDHINEWTKL
jgi:hypothetical protein